MGSTESSQNSRARWLSSPSAAALLDLPLEVLIDVCGQLDFRDLIRAAETCKRFRHGDGGLETAELPTKSPVVAALREHAFSGGVGTPTTRPIDCSESWVAYLARCARQRRCREAPPIAVGVRHTLFLDATGRLLSCGQGASVGHGEAGMAYPLPTTIVAVVGLRMRSVAAGPHHGLALGWDGRVYSWGGNGYGQLGHGDERDRPSPALMEGLESVRSMAASNSFSLVVTQSGAVFQCSESLRPIIDEGFAGMRVRHVRAGDYTAFAIGEVGGLLSWGRGESGLLGHGDTRNQPAPKRVEALQGIRMSGVSVRVFHALALAEDGLLYAWGINAQRALLSDPHVERELLPKQSRRSGACAWAALLLVVIAATQWRTRASCGRGEPMASTRLRSAMASR
jgi:hypothetical protein